MQAMQRHGQPARTVFGFVCNFVGSLLQAEQLQCGTLAFGLLHGFGLATKIQEYEISAEGLIPNLIAFNIGVEIGQLLALSAILIVMGYWRKTGGFWRHAYTANVAMMSAGFLLMGYQLTGLFVTA